jgi:hypothetical protein
LEEFGNGKGKLAKASEEGQGPRRAVEPMMMMNSQAGNTDVSVRVCVVVTPSTLIIFYLIKRFSRSLLET